MMALLLPAVIWGGCYFDDVIYNPVDSDRLNGRSIMVLDSVVLPPFTIAQQKRITNRVEKGILKSRQVGEVLTRKEFFQRKSVSLEDREDYKRFFTRLSLVNVSNPELAHRLGRSLGIELFTSVLVSYIPCSVCEEGDQIWLVGQVVEADRGQVVFRAHLREGVDTKNMQTITRISLELTDEFLEEFEAVFQPKWHRERFSNLKKQG